MVVNGLIFNNYEDVCRYYNVDIDFMKLLSEKFNYSIEEAINSQKKWSRVVVEGISFESYVEACRHCDVRKVTFQKRKGVGWSVEEALELVPRVVKGVIDKDIWNKRKILGIKILNSLGNNMYKCTEEDRLKYYSKSELVEKFRECAKERILSNIKEAENE